MAKDDATIRGARKKIQSRIEIAEEENRRLLLRKRIELANLGVRAYESHRLSEAVKAFHSYLRILEDWKGVSEGALNPGLFDPKKDIHELLLISGIYWDLVKLYDRTKTPERYQDFTQYLEKYILFSRGMAYQPLCAETLRKYISNEKPNHKTEFKNAYKALAESNCFIATSLLDVTSDKTLPRLRVIRDQVLLPSALGRAFISIYYRVGPGVSGVLDRSPQVFRRCIGFVLENLAAFVSLAENGTDSIRPEDELTVRKAHPKR